MLHRWYTLQERAGLALPPEAHRLDAAGRERGGPKTALMGHADMRTMPKIYTHFEEKRVLEAVGRIDGLLGAVSELE
jgi:hypothetical protein